MSQDSHQDDIDHLFLNDPHTEKHFENGEKFAFGGMQGWRKTNEDFHKHLVPVDQQSWKLWSYFAIFDGHNGFDTAKNASEILHQHLIETLNAHTEKHDENIQSSELDLTKLSNIIKQTFLQLDKELESLINDQSGSVCIATLIGPEHIYLINLGDSRAIIVSNEGKVLESTKDHKPNSRKEKERIRKAGGHVTQAVDDVPRVESSLAVSRTLGDYSFNKNIIPASPDIIQYTRQTSASFLVLACDGIWDVMSNEEVATFIQKRISHTSLKQIIEQLLDHCLQLETTDNTSVYIIKL